MRGQQSNQIPEALTQFSSRMYEKIDELQVLEKGWLRPIELVLRTHKNDRLLPQIPRKPLPQGLMIASKSSINDNAYHAIYLENRGFVQRDQNIERSSKHRKNLINLLKQVNIVPTPSNIQGQTQGVTQGLRNTRREFNNEGHIPIPTRFEIAICVCIYSQDATMLKQTMAAIKQNVISLVKSGVRQDAIGVFVFFDGITKIHPSVLDHITLMENLDINIKVSSTVYSASQDYTKSAIINDGEQRRDQKRELENKFFERYTSRIIYSEKELQDRRDRCLKEVYDSYIKITKLKEQIEKLKVDPEINYHALPQKIKEEFIVLAKQIRKQQHIQVDDLIFDLTYRNKQAEKALCLLAINNTQTYCNTYLNSRNELAYLSMHRELIYSKETFERERENQMARDPENIMGRVHTIPFGTDPSREEIHQQQQTHIRVSSQGENIKQIHLNLFFCVKYKNEGKLSSHNWFFNGFCKQLNPKYVILVDVGLKAKDNSIFAMYQHLKLNPKLGGVCGYMSLKIERTDDEDEVESDEVDWLTGLAHLVVDIQRAQQVEYHFAHLLDKPFQSLFKFIHVLPGAFSGYNMAAIHSPTDEEELILRKYFESLNEKVAESHIVETELTMWWMALKVLLPDFLNTLFLTVDPNSEQQLLCNENMNMAEDRILCFGIHKNGFDLAYLPDAYSEVDPIKSLHAMYGQRRRWINGSYFAFEKVKADLAEYSEESKSCEFFLKLQMLYLSLVNAVSYFSVSLFLFTFHISMSAFYNDVLQPLFARTLLISKVIPFFTNTMDFFYVFFVLGMIYCSLNLTYNNKKFKRFIYLSSTIFGIFSLIVIIVLVIDLSKGFSDEKNTFIQTNNIQQTNAQQQNNQLLTRSLRYIIICMFIFHAVPVAIHALIYRKFQVIVEVVFGVMSFLFYNPTYLITLNIYAICRMDDISWGTKGRDEDQIGQSKLKSKWRKIKFVHVFKYLLWNTILSNIFLNIQFDYSTRVVITLIIMSLITFILAAKLFLGLIYSLYYKATVRVIKVVQDIDLLRCKSQISVFIRSQKKDELTVETVTQNISSLVEKSGSQNERQRSEI